MTDYKPTLESATALNNEIVNTATQIQLARAALKQNALDSTVLPLASIDTATALNNDITQTVAENIAAGREAARRVGKDPGLIKVGDEKLLLKTIAVENSLSVGKSVHEQLATTIAQTKSVRALYTNKP